MVREVFILMKNIINSKHLKHGIKARILLLLNTDMFNQAAQSELKELLKDTSTVTLWRNLQDLERQGIINKKLIHGVFLYSIANINSPLFSQKENDFVIELCTAPLIGNRTNIFRVALALCILDQGQGVSIERIMKEFEIFELEALKKALSEMFNLGLVEADKDTKTFYLNKQWKYQYLDWL